MVFKNTALLLDATHTFSKYSLGVGDPSKNASARLNFTPLTNPRGRDL